MRSIRPSRQLICALALSVVLLPQLLVPQTQSSHQQNQSAAASPNSSNQAKVDCESNGTYLNSKGQTVKRPENCSGPPQGATARCRDGTYSFSQSRRGTCSHHNGVAKWL